MRTIPLKLGCQFCGRDSRAEIFANIGFMVIRREVSPGVRHSFNACWPCIEKRSVREENEIFSNLVDGWEFDNDEVDE